MPQVRGLEHAGLVHLTHQLQKVLNLPECIEPIVFTPLGYPADEPGIKRRKDLSELVKYEHW